MAVGDVCRYSEFLASKREPGLVFDYVPKLVALCLNAERTSGAPLTEAEFEELRMAGGGLACTLDSREAVWQEAYPDIRDYADYLAASERAATLHTGN